MTNSDDLQQRGGGDVDFAYSQVCRGDFATSFV